ncbi:threonine/serine ThrE exporter family protein [Clostridiisalibacter paucivorans]|uniref:threonine/serine ThrE exporter family protein n=1 Tax=Clostridiisalibacter paucivorans TaxID=408753 RepID=UPI000479B122|nr:threonine/serine exporter family protein [Clostridiisalibacter paucivorans]
MNKKDIKNLLILSILAGKIMLKSGAETYRVEDTISRICRSRKIKFVQSFVTPTGIFLSVEHEDEIFSYIKRVKSIEIDLEKITLVNNFSRDFVNSNMSVSEGMKILDKINEKQPISNKIKYFSGGLVGAFSSALFGGNLFDFIAAFFTSFIVVFVVKYMSKLNITYFLSNVIGSIVATLFAIVFSHIHYSTNIDMIIIGSIMPLVPGVAITNAIRDSISSEFLSGVSRTMEAIITALAIAFGVGITLNIYLNFFGGI